MTIVVCPSQKVSLLSYIHPSTQIQTVHSQKIGHFDECKESSLFGSFVVPKTVEVVSSVQSRTVM